VQRFAGLNSIEGWNLTLQLSKDFKKFSFHWLALYLPVKSDILKNSQSLKNLIFIRTKSKEKKNEYI